MWEPLKEFLERMLEPEDAAAIIASVDRESTESNEDIKEDCDGSGDPNDE